MSERDCTPLSPWAYFGLNILYSIPIVGLVFLFIHAIGANNINKRNYARSFFCVLIIAGIILLIMAISGTLSAFLEFLKNR